MLCLAALHTPHLLLLRVRMEEATCSFTRLASLRLDQLPAQPPAPLQPGAATADLPPVPNSVLLLQPDLEDDSIEVQEGHSCAEMCPQRMAMHVQASAPLACTGCAC